MFLHDEFFEEVRFSLRLALDLVAIDNKEFLVDVGFPIMITRREQFLRDRADQNDQGAAFFLFCSSSSESGKRLLATVLGGGDGVLRPSGFAFSLQRLLSALRQRHRDDATREEELEFLRRELALEDDDDIVEREREEDDAS